MPDELRNEPTEERTNMENEMPREESLRQQGK